MWYGEAFKNAKCLVDMINKIAPQVITIGGGYHATLYEEYLLENSNFDLEYVWGEFPLEKILDIADKYRDNWNKNNLE
mgnify:CR=1 FL=1